MVVSQAGRSDQVASDHQVGTLAAASLLHAGRPTVVTVGAGAAPLPGTSIAARAPVVERPPASVETPKP
jgi:uroporphyrin-III C-methyltransferase